MIKINILNDYSSVFSYQESFIKELVCKVFENSKVTDAHLSIIFTNRTYLSDLKKKYFNVNQFTDVIAFDVSDNKDCLEAEIYISIDDVNENSKIFKQTFNRELKRIIIHGVLHLLGFKDKTKEDIKEMRMLEENFLKNYTNKIIE